ncbi:MAG: MFS transporter [Acidimicrobiales bacterium]
MSTVSANLAWYRRHQLLAGAMFWVPTMMLFLIDGFGLAAALRLQAVYYAAVVVMEVPSGWLSDRFGRVLTLRVVAVAWAGAYSMFLLGDLAAVVLGQVLLAAGYAFLSGTDVTFHLESLEAEGRAAEFAQREASSRQGLLYVSAVSALLGGALAMADLRLPFVLSLVFAIAQLVVAMQFVEVPAERDQSPSFRADIARSAARLKDPLLAWVGLYMISQVVAVHLVAELTPAYLTDVFGATTDATEWAALSTGVIAAVVATVAALSLKGLPATVGRLGLAAVLLLLAAVPLVVMGAMAVVAAGWVLPLLTLRRVQAAASSVLVPAVVAAHVDAKSRATLLSMLSLAGRLSYMAVLLLLAGSAGDQLGRSLWLATAAIGVLWIAVVVGQRRVRDFPDDLEHDHDHVHDEMEHDHLHTHGDGHHDHHHYPPVEGPHRHRHHHPPMRHKHPHTRDDHHLHDR